MLSSQVRPMPRSTSRNWGKIAADVFTYAAVLFAVLSILIPALWMFSSALKGPDELYVVPMRWIPQKPQWSNFFAAWNALPFGRFLFNTVFVSTATAVLQLLNGALCAYVFARIPFPGRDLLFLLFLGLMMIPAQTIMIPAYVIMSRLKWINTYWALIIPHISSVFGIFMLRQAFLGIPNDLIDAGIMDGAGHLRLLFQLMLPLTKPQLVTLGLLAFTGQWNDYFWPLIMTDTMNMRTLPVGLAFLRLVEYDYEGWGIIMAGTLLVLLPILILFLLGQRYFVISASRSGLHGV